MLKVWRLTSQPWSLYFRRPYSLSASLCSEASMRPSARFKLGECELGLSVLTCAGRWWNGFPPKRCVLKEGCLGRGPEWLESAFQRIGSHFVKLRPIRAQTGARFRGCSGWIQQESPRPNEKLRWDGTERGGSGDSSWSTLRFQILRDMLVWFDCIYFSFVPDAFMWFRD